MKIEIKDGNEMTDKRKTKKGNNPSAREGVAEPAETPGETPRAEAEAEVEEDLSEEEQTYKEQLQRLAADFDNYRKRTAKEKQERYAAGIADLAQQLFPVIDNLRLAVESAKAGHDTADLLKGIGMVLRMFDDGFEQAGIRAIDVADGRFDPRFHEALFTEETDKAPEGTILLEIQKGYAMGDRLLRPTKVKTAVAPSSGEDEAGDDFYEEDDAPEGE